MRRPFPPPAVSYTHLDVYKRQVPGETTCDLAEQAARRALDAAGIAPGQIDLIVLGTTTPDHVFPSVATQLQHRLGCYGGPAFDCLLYTSRCV